MYIYIYIIHINTHTHIHASQLCWKTLESKDICKGILGVFTTAPAADFLHLFPWRWRHWYPSTLQNTSMFSQHVPMIFPMDFVPKKINSGATSSLCHPAAMARRGIANYEPAQPNEFNIFWQEILRHGNDGINGSLVVFLLFCFQVGNRKVAEFRMINLRDLISVRATATLRMYIYICINIYIYVYIYMYTCIHTYIYINKWMK